jgi:DNA-binding NtrC family response regulator
MDDTEETHDLSWGAPTTATVFRLGPLDDSGRSVEIPPDLPGRLFVGSSAACELCLDDRSVSRRHAAIEHLGRRLRIDDLDSTNGLTVDGVHVRSAYLLGGETLELGRVRVKVHTVRDQLAQLSQAPAFGKIKGISPAMRRLYPLLEKLARSNVTTLIEGETGTGKEVLAESIHEQSPRKSAPFVVFDCTSVAPTLLESALFGHERGAFTGAVTAHAGVFERADGGTLLIDEVGDLETPLQAKLLRAIERSEICRVGGSKWFKFDVRILAATRRDLEKEVQAGRFRDDLFYRLAIARVELPPLRERREDIELLASSFWRALGGAPRELTPAFLATLQQAPWPGNVRQLQNVLARRVALGDDADIGQSLHQAAQRAATSPSRAPDAPTARETSTPDVVASCIADDLAYAAAKARVLNDFERRFLKHVLDKHQGNISRAAAASGIARRYFYVLMSKHEPEET